jgi:protein-S-isoprenylcysteine O-methyltransferase Ste14
VWFALALASMLVLHWSVPVVQWNLGASRWAGLPFVGAGIALVAGGVRRFSSHTTLHPFREASELVTTGGFAWSRNPMYTGLVLSLLGAAILLGSLSSAACIPPFVLLLRLRFIAHEERALEARFGDAYRRYRRRVRRWL